MMRCNKIPVITDLFIFFVIYLGSQIKLQNKTKQNKTKKQKQKQKQKNPLFWENYTPFSR